MTDVEALRARLRAEGKLALQIRVTPKSPQTAWSGMLADGTYKLKIAAAPEKGKANAELVRFLAGEFAVERGAVEIVSGETSRLKQVRIGLGGRKA